MIKDWSNITRTIQIKEDILFIHGATSAKDLARLNFDFQLKTFRPAKKQKEALIQISKLDNGKIVTAQLKDNIVGYVTFHSPDKFERWSAGPSQILELGAIEVSPLIRKAGIARNMLEVAFCDYLMENYIVFATEYYWHWDLEGSGMHVWEYRDMMRRLMEHVGMVVTETDEEDINSHPANMLMVRYGKNIKNSTIIDFEKLLFLR